MHYIIIVKAWNDIIDTDKIGDTDTDANEMELKLAFVWGSP